MIVYRRIPIRFAKTFAERKQEHDMKKQQEMFKEMIDELSRKEVYNLKDFKREVEGQEKKGKSFFRKFFSEAQPEEIELEKTKKILNAFKDEELIGKVPVSGEIKEEIVQVSQTTIQEVNNLLTTFKFQQKLHQYLKTRRENGEYIPQTREELEIMMRTDRPESSKEEKYGQKNKFSNHQKKWIRGSVK